MSNVPSSITVGSVLASLVSTVAFRHPAVLAAFQAEDGKRIATVETCSDSDDAFVDGKRNHVYVICGAGYVDVLEVHGETYQPVSRVATLSGARTGLSVPDFDRLFVAARARGSAPGGRLGVSSGKLRTEVAVDSEHHRAFELCGSSHTLTVVALDSEGVRAHFPLPTGDVVKHDSGLHCAYAACSSGFIFIVQEDDPDHFTEWRTFPCRSSCRTSRSTPPRIVTTFPSDRRMVSRSRASPPMSP